MSAPLHPGIRHLAFLLGTWKGEGEGGYPTISSFKYGEEVKFFHVGKPVLAYSQKTWKLASGEPMHSESGYWKPCADGSIDVCIAQSTGIVEVEKGSVNEDSQKVVLTSNLVGNASKVTTINRTFSVTGDLLKYTVDMATTTQPLQLHLTAELKKFT